MVNPNKTWLPENYEIPKDSGNYLNKFPQGETQFRILSAPKLGYIYWTIDKKPVRSREEPKGRPANIQPGRKPKHFWAFVIWNYNEKKIQILEITQSTIQEAVLALVGHKAWGDPTKYDITVSRKGTTMDDTTYAVQPLPHTVTPPEALTAIEEKPLDLDLLFEGKDPFEEDAPKGGIASDEEIEADLDSVL